MSPDIEETPIDIIANNMADILETIKRKNADYSGNKEFFKNFRMVEELGLCSTEVGFIVRMTDKISRISTLVDGRDNKVSNESIKDTLVDLAAYSLLLVSYYEMKEKSVQKVSQR